MSTKKLQVKINICNMSLLIVLCDIVMTGHATLDYQVYVFLIVFHQYSFQLHLIFSDIRSNARNRVFPNCARN
jgi:heme A synthase